MSGSISRSDVVQVQCGRFGAVNDFTAPFYLNAMTVLNWAIRLTLFSFLVVFAFQNTDPVSLNFLPGQVWQAPLVIILLVFFAGGAILGLLSVLGVIYRQRREISRLKQSADKPSPVVLPELPPNL